MITLSAAPPGPSVARAAGSTWVPGPRFLALGRMMILTAGTLTAIGLLTDWLGTPLHPWLLALWGAGAFAASAWPAARLGVASTVGALALALVHPTFSLYFLALLLALVATRRHALPFAGVLAAAALLWPKLAFLRHYHQPAFWSWLHEPSLALALFAGALWLRARRDGNGNDDPRQFLLLFLFPSHATHPMAFQPVALAQPPQVDARATLAQLGWLGAKVTAWLALRHLGPATLLANLQPHDVITFSRSQLWIVVTASYVQTYLALATTADVPILVGRLYGFPLSAPFRAPLLAWSPVELWRRWGIYNRRFLLNLVYFPLGGGRRHPYRNIVLTFLASALIMHSGWFGSKYLEIGVGGWRDQSLYFLLQAAAVCACVAWTRRGVHPTEQHATGFGRSAPRVLGVVATQGWSALAHVVILAQGLPLGDRGHLIARCLGLG